jgi:hypothetical protein
MQSKATSPSSISIVSSISSIYSKVAFYQIPYTHQSPSGQIRRATKSLPRLPPSNRQQLCWNILRPRR